jgi:hypothetical protein
MKWPSSSEASLHYPDSKSSGRGFIRFLTRMELGRGIWTRRATVHDIATAKAGAQCIKTKELLLCIFRRRESFRKVS